MTAGRLLRPGTCRKNLTFTALLGYRPSTLSIPIAAALWSTTWSTPQLIWLWCKKSSWLMKVLAWLLKGGRPDLGGTSQFSLEFAPCSMGSVPARLWLLEATMAWGLSASPLPSCLVVPRVA